MEKSKNGNMVTSCNWIGLIFDGNEGVTGKKLTPAQNKAYSAIKNSAKEFAKTVAENTTESGGQMIALRLIREAFFSAGHAVATETASA